MLDDEERGDVELRNQFRERWTRTKSASLTAPLRAEAKKYMDIIQNAITADKIVQEKYRANRDSIVLLSKQTVSSSFDPIPILLFNNFSMKLPTNYPPPLLPVLCVIRMLSKNSID